MGDPRQAQALCQRLAAPFPCLADPERAAYRDFGLRRGTMMEVAGPANWRRGLAAMAKGHLIERTTGDPMQLSGTFIIATDGRVRYARYGRHAADHPQPSELIAALRSLTEPSA